MLIPMDTNATNYYGQCYEAENWEEGGQGPCNNINQFMYYDCNVKGGCANADTYSYCTSVANNPADGITRPCSQLPLINPSQPASSSNGGMSVYTYMGGNPNVPPPANNSGSSYKIPMIGGHYPIDMSASDAAGTLMGYFAGETYEGFTGLPPYTGQTGGYLILAYLTEWITSFQDLDYFAPNSLTGSSSSPFLNQNGTQFGDKYSSDGQFHVATPTGPGATIDFLEVNWYALLGSFCGGISTVCMNSMNQNGVKPPFCSNIFAARNDGGMNYCNNMYTLAITKTSTVSPCSGTGQSNCSSGQECVETNCLTPCPTGTKCQNGFTCDGTYCQPPLPPNVSQDEVLTTANVISSYCQNFNPAVGDVPNECLCQQPGSSQAYNNIISGFEKNQAVAPYTTDSYLPCWWLPCQNPNAYLLPPDLANINCPNVCAAIQNFIANGGVIDVNGSTLEQTVSCCASSNGSNPCTSPTPNPPPTPPNPTTCKTNSDCSKGEICIDGNCVLQCQSSSDCSSGQSCENNVCVPSFWSKYKLWFIVGGIVLLIILVAFLLYFFVFRKR